MAVSSSTIVRGSDEVASARIAARSRDAPARFPAATVVPKDSPHGAGRYGRLPAGGAAQPRVPPSAFLYHRLRCSNGPRCQPGRASSAPGFPAARSVSIAAYVLAGSRLETAGQVGVAHFMEHLTFKGTAAYPSTRAISEAIEGVGGSFNAATDRESTVYWVRVPRREAARAMDVLGELIVRPRLDEARHRRANAPSSSRRSARTSTTRPSTARSCSRPRCSATGRSAARSAARRRTSRPCPVGAIHDFWRSAYRPANTVVAVAGDLDHDEAIGLAAAAFGTGNGVRPRLRAGADPAGRAADAGPGDATRPRRSSCLGVPALRRDHPDSWTLAVLNAVLGDGMSSRLFLSVREELGLAYDVSSGLVDYADAGALEVSAGVDPAEPRRRRSRRSSSSWPGSATSRSRRTS